MKILGSRQVFAPPKDGRLRDARLPESVLTTRERAAANRNYINAFRMEASTPAGRRPGNSRERNARVAPLLRKRASRGRCLDQGASGVPRTCRRGLHIADLHDAGERGSYAQGRRPCSVRRPTASRVPSMCPRAVAEMRSTWPAPCAPRCRRRARTRPVALAAVGSCRDPPLTCENAVGNRWYPLGVCGHLADSLRTD